MATSETPQDFRDRAAECERLAEQIMRPEVRETLLYVAASWRRMADEDETRLQLIKVASVAPTAE